jgi:hypothetical protein
MADNAHTRNPLWFTAVAFVAFVPILFLGAVIIDIIWDVIGTPGGDPASANSITRNVLGICFGFLLFYFAHRWAGSRLNKKS